MRILDTDTLSLLFNENPTIVQRVAKCEDKLGITVITRIESLKGRFEAVLKAANAEELRQAIARLEKTERNLAAMFVVPFDEAAFEKFDELRKNKRVKKIGRADLLIGCIALAQKAMLVTRNTRDFQQVPGLRLENWAD